MKVSTRRVLTLGLFAAARLVFADVPTEEEACVLRNLAVCDFHGVPSMTEGPCPPTAKTLKPQGTEDCKQLSRPAGAPPELQAVSPLSGRVAPREDLAWVGAMERWLIPTVLFGGGGSVLVAVWWTTRAKRRGAAMSVVGVVAKVVVALGVSVPVAYRVSGVVFARVFGSFDNHDTAAPGLLAAPFAGAAFIGTMLGLVTVITVALTAIFKPRQARVSATRRT